MKKSVKKATALLLAMGMTVGSVMTDGSMKVSAQQAMGTAPFINSWLVSGPFDEPVADVIYNDDGTHVPRPSDGNWARVAEVSASSTWQTGQIDYPGNSPSPSFAVGKAIDGDMTTAWVAQTHNRESGGPEDWPTWDPKPEFYLDWKQPVSVKKIETFGRGGTPEFTKMTCVLKDKDGTVLEEKDITKTGTDTTGEVVFEEAVDNVYRVEIAIIYEGKPANVAGIGFAEIHVLDTAQQSEEGRPERPSDGNWAALAKAVANSEFNGSYAAKNAIDGNAGTDWASKGDDGIWPKTLTLEWDYPITVKQIEALSRAADTADNDYDNVSSAKCELFDKDGTLLGTATTTDPTATETGVAIFDDAVPEVTKLVMTLDGRQGGNIGFREVYVLDGQDSVAPERPSDGNWAPNAKVEVNSVFSGSYPATNVIDGNISTEWASKGGDGILPKTLTMNWDYPIEVKRIEAFSRWSDSGSDFVDSILCKLYDADGKELASGTTTDPKANTVGYVEFDEVITGVRKAELILNGSETGNIGLREVYVLDGKGVTLPEQPEPLGDISPEQGAEFGTTDGAKKEWEYFDDRIWNRTYDDYQDLYGYFTVKKGLDTRNKYVFAHTYVYSPEEQLVQLRAGATGSYRLFLNDVPVTAFSKPAEVQKDMTVENIRLKQGWNKLLIEINHTFTEDLNSNGIPIARDSNVSYLGFYARFTDRLGNQVDNLAYSVNGGTGELQIATGGLHSDDIVLNENLKDGKLSDSEWDRELGFGMGLPTNNMPIGYKEWPYVWNKSTTSNAFGVSASAFQFEAAGGKPGYKWKIVKGELPLGLELTEDGRIADGLVDGMPDLNSDKGIISIDCPEGDYTFTVQVTDADHNKAEKEFTIQVKERPNKWFEEGGVSALSHHIVMANWYTDPNFSADRWAERAKLQGHSMVSIEALQQDYYWPSKFMDPNHRRHMYSPMDENGQIVETLKSFEEAVKRYGMQFGLYYATEGGGLRHDSSDVFIQNVSELIQRYEPVYLYFDGPQALPWVNFDAMYSAVRNYSDEIIINSNAWGEEFGDPDLGTIEASPHYSNPGTSHFVKKVVFEPWKGATFPGAEGGYYPHKRNDYRLTVKEMITNIGRGYADNFEQGPGTGRGATWDSPEVMADVYAPWLQRNMDVRDDMAAWFAPEGLPDRHESTTGTSPYFLAGYGYEDNGKGNYDEFAHPNANKGPRWGYAVSRDNNIYLHILRGADGKIGFDAITDKKLEIGPFKDTVVAVSCLNTDEPVTGFKQDGENLTIDLANVTEDQVDTIIKITTDSPERKYKLTNLYLEGEQLSKDALQIKVEGQMTFPALKVKLDSLTFESADSSVASVNASGIVTPGKDGKTSITVKGTYENITVENSIQVTSNGGKIYIGEEMLSAVLSANGLEAYGELMNGQTAELKLNGRAATGGSIGLDAAKITWHTGTIDLKAGDDYVPIVIEENDIFSVKNNILTPKTVESKTRAVVWADVELDGTKVTSNRVYFDLQPYDNLASDAVITASEKSEYAKNVADSVKINGAGADSSKWSASASGESWIQFDFGVPQQMNQLSITFNSKEQYYVNSPKTYDIQISDDGENWETVSTQNGPSGEAWMNVANNYDIGKTARYLRLYFYGGANNGSAVDVLEAAVYGIDTRPDPEEPSSVIRELLQQAYDLVKDEDTSKVVDSATKVFEDALHAAKMLLDNPKATDAEMLEAWNNLVDATHGLGLLKGDKSILEVLIQKAEDMVMNADKYVTAEWQMLLDKLESAKAVMADGDAMDDDIRPAEDALLNAILAQRFKADKSNLEELLKTAEELNLEGYTAESVQAFKTALARAMEVMADDTLSEDDQQIVDDAVKALADAKDGLQLASNDNGDSNKTDDSKNDNQEVGTDKNNSNDGNEIKSNAKDSPKTGDSAPITLWLTVVLMMAGLAIILKIRNRHQA